MKKVLFCFYIGMISSIYFLPEIIIHSKNTRDLFISYVIQSFHDGVCFYFILVYFLALYNLFYYIQLNTLYTLIMVLFSFYKRCILTLIYNSILNLPACTRYIPVWQRLYNMFDSGIRVCNNNNYQSTYLWLNDHIFQSGMMIIMNIRWLFLIQMRYKNNFNEI